MKNKFTFETAQAAQTSFIGNITIEATTEEEAKIIIQNMTQQELDDKSHGWILSDEATPDGPVEVYDESGMMINEI